jgi:hypothetical protein
MLEIKKGRASCPAFHLKINLILLVKMELAPFSFVLPLLVEVVPVHTHNYEPVLPLHQVSGTV